MMWLIITIILSTIIGIIASKIGDDLDKVENFIAGFATTGLILICIVAILATIAIFNRTTGEEYEVEQYKIQGLENNIETKQETNGAFVLGFGYINSSTSEKIKYYYFKVNDLGKKLESKEIYNYSNTYIRETNKTEPCLIYKMQETKNEGFWKILFGEDIWTGRKAEILVVPENTIKIEYNVDI